MRGRWGRRHLRHRLLAPAQLPNQPSDRWTAWLLSASCARTLLLLLLLLLQAGTATGRSLTDAGSTRAWGLLTYAPYLVPFHERARVFQAVVSQVGGAPAPWEA